MQAQEQKPNIGQAPRKKVPRIRIFFLSLTILIIFILGFFLIQNNEDSSATLLNAIFIVIAVLIGIGQLIPIVFPSAPQPSTIVQNFYSSSHPQAQTPQPATPPPPDNTNAPATQNQQSAPSPINLPIEPIFYFNVAHLPHPNELYGRKRERLRLLERTRKGDSTSIVGPCRIGKTWLLDYLKFIAPTEVGTQFSIASLDGTMTRRRTVSTFVNQILDAFDVHIVGNHIEMELDLLAPVVENLRKKKVIPVLCIDEFEGLLNRQGFDYDFFTGLRYIATKGLVIVTVSESPLVDLMDKHSSTSPFFNIFEQVTLRPFTQAEAEEFIRNKGKIVGFHDYEYDMLLKYTEINKQKWPPLRLQLAGDMLLTDKKLGMRGHRDHYRPKEQNYWNEFQQRLEEIYQGVVR